MSKFKIGQKVYVIRGDSDARPKTDGRVNRGTITGIEKVQEHGFLYYMSEADFLADLTTIRYKIVYVDVFTKRLNSDWVYEDDLSVKEVKS